MTLSFISASAILRSLNATCPRVGSQFGNELLVSYRKDLWEETNGEFGVGWGDLTAANLLY